MRRRARKLAGWGPEDVPAGAVELPHAAEPGCERHVGQDQVGVIQKATGKVSPARPGELIRGQSQLGSKQTTKMAARHTQAAAQLFLGPAVESAVRDELDGAAHDLLA